MRFVRVIAWLFAACACAQTNDLRAKVVEAWGNYQRGEFDQARRSYEEILGIARARGNRSVEGHSYRMLGMVCNKQARYREAARHLETAAAVLEELNDHVGLGQTYDALGFSAWASGDLDLARRRYTRALEEFRSAGQVPDQAAAAYNLAFIMPAGANRRKALEEAVGMARRAGNPVTEAKGLQSLGDDDFNHGDFAAAAARTEQAAQLPESAGAESGLALVLTSLGRVYRAHGRPEQAIETYGRVLRIQEKSGDVRGMMQTHHALSAALGAKGDHRQALESSRRAADLARQSGSPAWIAEALANYGSAYIDLKQYSRGVEILEEAVRVSGSGQTARLGLADGYLALGRPLEAKAAIEVALAAPAALTIEQRMSALSIRAQASRRLGAPEAALADLREAMRLLDETRARLAPDDYFKRGFNERRPDLVHQTVALMHDLGRHSEALEAAEQSRARAFLDLLASRNLPAPPEPRSTLLTYRGSPPALGSAAHTGAYSAGKLHATAARLKSAILAYWVAPGSTYLWLVRPGAPVAGFRVAVPAGRLRELVAEASNQAAGPSRGEGESRVELPPPKAWEELYRLLIRPAAALLPARPSSRLTIIPHDHLFRLSFAGLRDERGRYLIERFELHYAPAGAVFDFTDRGGRRPLGSGYLLVSDPSPLPPGSDGKRLPALPGARREAAAVAAIAGRANTTLLMGPRALEEKFREAAASADVLHFATHGVIRDDEPFASFLALGASGGAAPEQDGRLTAQELYGLNLNARLVVLSACRTALGKVSGDGIAGLTRSFFYAGASSVVAALWNVADEPTERLITAFYRARAGGAGNSQALRRAQIGLIEALRAGKVKVGSAAGPVVLPENPVFWAGFVLQGEP